PLPDHKGNVAKELVHLLHRREPPPGLAESGKGRSSRNRIHTQTVTERVGLDNGGQRGDAVKSAKVGDRFIFRQMLPFRSALLALDRAAVAAVIPGIALLTDGCARI